MLIFIDRLSLLLIVYPAISIDVISVTVSCCKARRYEDYTFDPTTSRKSIPLICDTGVVCYKDILSMRRVFIFFQMEKESFVILSFSLMTMQCEHQTKVKLLIIHGLNGSIIFIIERNDKL